MKTLRLLLAIFTLGLAFASCQKDFSFEAGNSKGTLLKTTAGDCDGINVQGIYFKDTLLKSSNYVDVQVDFSKIGTYTIKSDTVNGYSFNAVGNITALGVNTVRLVGVGKPIADGFNAFNLIYNGSTCLFNVQVLLGTGGGSAAAVYTFGLTGMACTGATLAGTYTAGVAMSPSNTVTIPITVTTPGSYNITTSLNGITFSGSGNLAVTTPSITLTATGVTPNDPAASSINFPVNSGTTTCEFAVPFAATPSAATFAFNCGAGTNINGTYQVGVNSASVNNYIDFPITVSAAGLIPASSTPTVNGFSFANPGVIVTAATTFIRYFATGTPTTSGFSIFSNPCNNISVTVLAPSAATNIISFTANGGPTTKTFNFNNGADTSVITPVPAVYEFEIEGQSNSTLPTETFYFSVVKPAFFTNGIPYNLNQAASGIIISATYTDAAGDEYDADGFTAGTAFVVTITTINTATNRVVGTFTGTLKNSVGVSFVITNGTFDLPLL